MQETKLPETTWQDCSTTGSVRLWEHEKQNGNVRLSELAILCAFAAGCAPGTKLFEIGTFDGRTTINLAANSPGSCNVFTLDLPPTITPKYSIAEGERHLVDKAMSGARYEKHRASSPALVAKITQLLGDSATFDYTPYEGSCSLIFVDGSHAYDYLLADTRTAMKLAKHGGVIVWHDYGIWEGVTRGLEELDQREKFGLRNIRGTSLVYWQKK